MPLVELIPVTTQLDQNAAQHRCERLSFHLIELKARFQRSLHQDEFSPRRPDQTQGLRLLQGQIEELTKGVDPEALDQVADLLDLVDTCAISELFDDACRFGLDITSLRNEVAPEEQTKKLVLLTKALQRTIDRLSRARGPTESKSIRVLVSQLGVLWNRETGRQPTASSDEFYRTKFESFALAVTAAFLPTEQWFEVRKHLPAPGSINKFAAGKVAPAVLQAVRETRETGSSHPGRPPRG